MKENVEQTDAKTVEKKASAAKKEIKAEAKAEAAPQDLKALAPEGWLSYLLITAILLGVLFLSVFISNLWVKSEANELTEAYSLMEKDDKGEKQPKGIKDFSCPGVTDEVKLNYIKNQKAEIARFAESHRTAAIKFYCYFYSTFVVFALFGTLSLICLAVIAKSGYANANRYLITIFLVSGGIVVTYQGFFGVFQQKTNIDNNAKLFGSYAKLSTKIDTFCTTGKIPVVNPTNLFNEAVAQQSKPADAAANKTNTNNQAVANSNANQKPSESPSPTNAGKLKSFYLALDTDEFINFIGWQLAELKEISIALDEKSVVLTQTRTLAFPN